MNPQMRNHKCVMTYLIKNKENAMILRCTHLHLQQKRVYHRPKVTPLAILWVFLQQ